MLIVLSCHALGSIGYVGIDTSYNLLYSGNNYMDDLKIFHIISFHFLQLSNGSPFPSQQIPKSLMAYEGGPV
jgi:hypothetical protein